MDNITELLKQNDLILDRLKNRKGTETDQLNNDTVKNRYGFDLFASTRTTSWKDEDENKGNADQMKSSCEIEKRKAMLKDLNGSEQTERISLLKQFMIDLNERMNQYDLLMKDIVKEEVIDKPNDLLKKEDDIVIQKEKNDDKDLNDKEVIDNKDSEKKMTMEIGIQTEKESQCNCLSIQEKEKEMKSIVSKINENANKNTKVAAMQSKLFKFKLNKEKINKTLHISTKDPSSMINTATSTSFNQKLFTFKKEQFKDFNKTSITTRPNHHHNNPITKSLQFKTQRKPSKPKVLPSSNTHKQRSKSMPHTSFNSHFSSSCNPPKHSPYLHCYSPNTSIPIKYDFFQKRIMTAKKCYGKTDPVRVYHIFRKEWNLNPTILKIERETKFSDSFNNFYNNKSVLLVSNKFN